MSSPCPSQTLLSPDVQQHLYGILSEAYVDDLCSTLFTPPLTTVIRVNTAFYSRAEVKERLLRLLETQNIDRSRVTREDKQWHIFEHPLLDDVLWTPSDSRQPVQELSNKVVVDTRCGESVLRGADVYAPGVMAAPSDLHSGLLVSVYADVNQHCRRGETQTSIHNSVFVGNGHSQMSRGDIFCDCVKPSGVAVVMTQPIFPAPALSGILPNAIFLQNLPSIVATHILNPQQGECILDMCASPGGKTTHIASRLKNKGIVVALDKTQPKIDRIQINLARFHLSCVQLYKCDGRQTLSMESKALPHLGDPPPYGPCSFDRILVDAPCSGLGRRPQFKCPLTLKELYSFPTLQKGLLATAFHLLKPSGTLVYCTCTLSPEENENQVAWLLKKFPELTLVKQEPCLGGQGFRGHGLTEIECQLVQRFDPTVASKGWIESSRQLPRVPTPDTLHSDTIGFFIACFKKSTGELVEHTNQ